MMVSAESPLAQTQSGLTCKTGIEPLLILKIIFMIKRMFRKLKLIGCT